MGVYRRPGVFVLERDVPSVASAVATASAAIVGESEKGPLEPVLITNTKQFTDYFGEPELGNYFHYSALGYLEHGNQLYALRVVGDDAYYGGALIKYGSGEDCEAVAAGVTVAELGGTYEFTGAECMLITGANPGAWNNNITVSIEDVDAVNHFFNLVVYYTDEDGNTDEVENWRVSRVQDKVDGYGKNAYVEDVVNAQSMYIRVLDNDTEDEDEDPEECTDLDLEHGADGDDVTTAQWNTAWNTYFLNPDLYSVRILINAGWTEEEEQTNLITIAEAREDCMAILDIPSDLTVTGMGTWRNTTLNANTSRAALYADWLEVYDNYNDKLVEVPPSGYVAGLYAYNDYVANDAYAPAGLKRGNLNSACGVTTVFTAGEMETLYSDYQINPIRYMPEGIAVWGQKTLLTTPGNLDRINVRRSITGMELAISSSLKNYVFEPNDTFSRLQITQMIESYMAQRKADRAVQEYLVVCDDTNNSDSTIDAHELHVDIYVKPQQVAEFIQLRAIITRTGASFTELVV